MTTDDGANEEILARLTALQQTADANAKRIEDLEAAPALAPVSGARSDAAGLTESEVRALISEHHSGHWPRYH